MRELNNTNPLSSLKDTLCFMPCDFSLNHRTAWAYGIIVGWDNESLAELKVKHKWSDYTVNRLKMLRKIYKELSEEL